MWKTLYGCGEKIPRSPATVLSVREGPAVAWALPPEGRTNPTELRLTRTLPLIALLSLSTQTMAQRDGFGLGFILGEPNGISFKGWLNDTRAIDGAVAWDLNHNNTLNLHADYLFHNYDLIRVNKGALPLYFGPGVRFRAWQDGRYWRHGEWHDTEGRADLAFRFPVGLAYQFDRAPLDVFLEFAPAIGLLPATYFDIDGGLGMRYWF